MMGGAMSLMGGVNWLVGGAMYMMGGAMLVLGGVNWLMGGVTVGLVCRGGAIQCDNDLVIFIWRGDR